MERKEAKANRERIEAVLNILKKQAPLTVKQVRKFRIILLDCLIS